MSLQKGFFITEPFNPSPFWDNTIVNLSGAQKFDEDTVFPAGRYSVDVQAGSGGSEPPSGYPDVFRVKSRRVTQTFIVREPFLIKAYCGSRGWTNSAGVNPYVGEFKVNGVGTTVSIPAVNHIFGNAGSASGSAVAYYAPSGGNCLGNGAYNSNVVMGSGAGSCLHFIPVGGTFGSNYLYAVHIAPGGTTGVLGWGAGGGSAYGGAGSGGANSSAGDGVTSQNGGSTPFGSGGAGVYAAPGVYSTPGNNGSGIGSGYAETGSQPAYGGAAYFDGTSWVDANSNGLFGGAQEDGHIIVKFLGNLN